MVSRRAAARKRGLGVEGVRVVFVRHGEKRKGEADPELTSVGHAQAAETAAWLHDQNLSPTLAMTTPTARTRQTADELLLPFPPVAREERSELPESREDWDVLVDPLARRLGTGVLLLVGHHPTLHFLCESFGPPPVPVPRHHFASALLLSPVRGGWRMDAAWPGRAG